MIHPFEPLEPRRLLSTTTAANGRLDVTDNKLVVTNGGTTTTTAYDYQGDFNYDGKVNADD